MSNRILEAQNFFIRSKNGMNIFIILILLSLLIVAAYYDCKHYRISNALVGFGALTAIALNSGLSDGIGFSNALLGLGLGLMAMLPFYLVRIMGAGDVKLIAMVGAFIGPQLLIPALFYIIISGGILALYIMLRRNKLLRLLEKIRSSFYQWFGGVVVSVNQPPSSVTADGGSPVLDNHQSQVRLPYGVAIAVGTALCLLQKNFAAL